MRLRPFATLLIVLALAAPGWAQETRGAIEGVIKDTSGAVLPGATVEAKSATGTVSTTTDASGAYRFPALSPGQYEIVATLQGFKPAATKITVVVGQQLQADLNLAVGGLTETVSVTALTTSLDTKQSGAATNIQAETIALLPKGRDFQSLVTLAPGANSESRSGGISVDGASAAENKFYVDGVDATNLRTGVAATSFNTDFIEEVQIKSSGHAAEFGGATGGVISVISRSGTNNFSGSVGTYFNNEAFNGKLALNNSAGTGGLSPASGLPLQIASGTRRELRLLLSGANEAETVEYPKDDYSHWEPAFQLGGPIIRNKLWFWGGYAPLLDSTSRTVTFRSNGQTDTFTSEETTQTYAGNISWQVAEPVRLRVAVQDRPYTQEGRLPLPNGTSNPATAFRALGLKTKNLTTTTNLDWVASSKAFFNAKINYLSYDTVDVGIPNENWYTFSGSNAPYETRPDMVRAAGFNSVLTNRARSKDLYSRFGGSADMTYYASAGGQHAFKAGVQFEQITNDVADIEQQPHVTVSWNQSLTTLAGAVERGTYGYWSWRQFGTLGKVNVNNLGLFFQDAWTVNEKLTLNLGIRTEKEVVPSYRANLDGIDFSFGDKLAPRAGFAYDLKGDGRWKLYGSWGIFYDVMKLELPRGAFGGDVWVEDYYTLDTLDWNTLMVNNNKPGRKIDTVDFRIPSNDPACPECGAIDPDLKPFKQQEIVAGIEHELTPTMAISGRYVHKQVDRAIEDVGVIVPGIGEVFYIANPGEGVTTTLAADECPTCPGLPAIQRDYDAFEFKLMRRLSNNWSFNASYTLSRLFGNYPGLASSDEIARVSPNVTRLFDGLVMAFAPGGEPMYGRLNTDRPHQFKFNAAYILPTRTTIGGVLRAASGIPITRQVNMQSSLPVFYEGRESDGRTPWLTVTDLSILQDVKLSGRFAGQVVLNVLNLFDQSQVTDNFRVQTRANLPIGNLETFFAGFDTEQRITANNILRDPRFLQNSVWQSPREVRLGFKLMF
jgi:hypothetical protein